MTANPVAPTSAHEQIALVFKDVRRVMLGDGPWWALADLCAALRIEIPKQPAPRCACCGELDHDAVRSVIIDAPNGPQFVVVVSRHGFLNLLMEHPPPFARKFCRFVRRQVEPAIQRGVRYDWGTAPDNMLAFLNALELAGNETSVTVLAGGIDQ